MKTKLLNTFSLLAILFLASCGNYEEFKEDPSGAFQGVAGANALTFNEVLDQVLGPKCLKCHANYDQYDAVNGNLAAITAAVRSDRMPQDGPLSEREKQILFSWIFSGAPRGEVRQTPPPVQAGPTFKSLARGVFAAKCIVCHRVNPNDPDDRGEAPFALNDRTDLLVYATQFNPFVFDFIFPEESEFVKRLRSDNPVELMPPARSGFSPVTDEERELVIEWIRRGLP